MRISDWSSDVCSSDLRLIAFYRDVLGCTLAHEQPQIGLWHLRAGTALIDIMDRRGKLAAEGDAAPDPARRNLDHLCLRIDPFDAGAILPHLAAHGVTAEPPADSYGSEGAGPSLSRRSEENKSELPSITH